MYCYNSLKEAEKALEEAMGSSGYAQHTHWRIERQDFIIVDERIAYAPIAEDKLIEVLQAQNLFLHGNTAYQVASINRDVKEFTLRNNYTTHHIAFKFSQTCMVKGELQARSKAFGNTYTFKVFRPID